MSKNKKYILILVILGYFFFFFGNGIISLSNPDEVFYSQTAKEMVIHHSWMTPFLFDQPQFEKPILIYWFLRVAFAIFGVNSFAARFFPALFALIGVIAVYFFAKLLFKEERKAFISALVLLSSALYIGLARTVFTDMLFSVLILLALLSFYWGYVVERRKSAGIILFFIFSALAVLAKGPLGILVPFAVVIVFLLLERKIKYILCPQALWGLAAFLAIALPWYIFMISRYGQGFIHEFFYNDHIRRLIEAEHKSSDTLYFYPLIMIAGMLPWSFFVAVALFYAFRNIRKGSAGSIFLLCWVVVTFVIFLPARSKLASYIVPLFPALALICGNFIYNSIAGRVKQRRFSILSGLLCIASLIILATLVAVIFKFSYYFSSVVPLYLLIALFIIWLAVIVVNLFKKRFFALVYSIALFMPVFIAVVPFVHKDIEAYFSSEYACEYLLSHYPVNPDSCLLASKAFVRGTRFYTDMKVAVYAPGANNFFSAHPIAFLDTDAKAIDFLRKQPLTYAFLKKSALEELDRISAEGIGYEVLKNIGNQYLVRIKAL